MQFYIHGRREYTVNIRQQLFRDVYKRQTVFCPAAVFLRVLAFGVDNQPDNDRPRNADK